MRRTIPRPQRVFASENAGDMPAQMLVGNKYYLIPGRERRHHALGIAACHAHVALGLDLRRGIHVAYRLRAGMPRL